MTDPLPSPVPPSPAGGVSAAVPVSESLRTARKGGRSSTPSSPRASHPYSRLYKSGSEFTVRPVLGRHDVHQTFDLIQLNVISLPLPRLPPPSPPSRPSSLTRIALCDDVHPRQALHTPRRHRLRSICALWLLFYPLRLARHSPGIHLPILAGLQETASKREPFSERPSHRKLPRQPP